MKKKQVQTRQFEIFNQKERISFSKRSSFTHKIPSNFNSHNDQFTQSSYAKGRPELRKVSDHFFICFRFIFFVSSCSTMYLQGPIMAFFTRFALCYSIIQSKRWFFVCFSIRSIVKNTQTHSAIFYRWSYDSFKSNQFVSVQFFSSFLNERKFLFILKNHFDYFSHISYCRWDTHICN